MQIKAEANLSALIESTEDLIWSVDLDDCLITFNSALKQHIESIFGVRLAAGMLPKDIVSPERAELLPALYKRVRAEGSVRVEFPLADGRTLDLALSPIIVDGNVTGISVFGKDITERKAAESALKEAEKKYQDIFEGALEGFYQTTPEGRFLAANPALAKMLGYNSPDDLVSTVKDTSHDVWVDPDERAKFARQLEEQGTIRGYECRFKRKDGTPIWVSINCRRVCGSDGRTAYFEGFIQDITERKRAEALIRNSEELYRATFEQAPVGILHTAFDGRILMCNARFAEIIGYPADEVPGMTFQQITAPEDLASSIEVLEQMSSGAIDAARWEKRYIRKDGSPTWVTVATSIRRDDEERLLYSIALIEDINARKAAEERLATAQEALRASEVRYRTVFQTSLDAISINRVSDRKYVDVNQAFLDITGFEREEVMGRTSLELNIWADDRDLQKLVEILRQNYSCRGLEAQFRKKNGEVSWGEISAEVIELEGVSCIISITRDISAAKAAEERLATAQEALRASEERYRTVFQTSPDLVDINRLDDGTFIDANDAYLDILGFEREEVIGRTSWELNIWADPLDLQNFVELLRQNSNCRNLEANLRRKNGEIFSALISAARIELDGVSCIVSITRDMSAAKAAENTIRNLAFYDPLTGLPNRRLLMDRLRQALAASAQWDRSQALLLIDLDNLKMLNETLGHQTGDYLLQEFARRLAACVRDTDTVARLGGDEFVVMLEDLSEVPEEAAAEAKAVCEKILASVGQPYLFNDRECLSSASIGIAVFGDRQNSMDDILQQADIALHQAKAAGRNTVRFFSPALQTAVNARAALEEDLRKAIKTNQFLLYYQPQVELGRLTGAEALIRWKHPLRGIVPPDEFIPLAEETGLILPLGEWVLENACTQIASWAGWEQTADFTVAVNISALQLRQPDFVEGVLAALDRTGANPKRLRLELTESMLVENLEEVIAKMTQLRSHGLRFALDDFGTGYSSLAYLKRLPLDRLKIDRVFVRDILVDSSSGAIAQTILSLGRAMGLPVIAEGVETEEQLAFLAGLGCQSFQGYLFSRPLPLKEFQAFLQNFGADAEPLRQ